MHTGLNHVIEFQPFHIPTFEDLVSQQVYSANYETNLVQKANCPEIVLFGK